MVRYNSGSRWGNLDRTSAALARRIDVRAGDLSDPFCVREFVAGQEVVFHLGALVAIPYSYEAPAQYVETNVHGTLNLLEACLRAKVSKVVHTSTSEVYGTALYVPIDEKHPRQGQSPYSATKIGADALVESFHRSFGLQAAIARPFNTYGPRQSARCPPTIASQLLSGAEEIKVGSFDPIRDFTTWPTPWRDFGRARSSKSAETISTWVRAAASRWRRSPLLMKITGRQLPVATDSKRVRPAKSEVMRRPVTMARRGVWDGAAGLWKKGSSNWPPRVIHISDYKTDRCNVWAMANKIVLVTGGTGLR